jgi:hypothetical protein
MVKFTADDDLQGAELDGVEMPGARFRLVDLSDARFDQSYLTGAVMRGVDLSGADVDGDVRGMQINGVEVWPLIEAELNRQHPGRELRRSPDPAEQLRAFEAAQRGWADLVERVTARPELRDARLDGEWSPAQTMRHLVLATDGWLRHGVLRQPDAFWQYGLPFTEWDEEAARLGIDVTATPSWDEVLAARTDRVAQVRDFLTHVTPEQFAAETPGLPPWAEGRRPITTGACLGVIGNEEWEHLRFAVRDLDAIEARQAP